MYGKINSNDKMMCYTDTRNKRYQGKFWVNKRRDEEMLKAIDVRNLEKNC